MTERKSTDREPDLNLDLAAQGHGGRLSIATTMMVVSRSSARLNRNR